MMRWVAKLEVTQKKRKVDHETIPGFAYTVIAIRYLLLLHAAHIRLRV